MVILCIIIGDVNQFIGYCLFPLDPWVFQERNIKKIFLILLKLARSTNYTFIIHAWGAGRAITVGLAWQPETLPLAVRLTMASILWLRHCDSSRPPDVDDSTANDVDLLSRPMSASRLSVSAAEFWPSEAVTAAPPSNVCSNTENKIFLYYYLYRVEGFKPVGQFYLYSIKQQLIQFYNKPLL